MLYDALASMTRVLRPWVVDFHIAQNDATVKGSGSHDKTGRHCLPNDPNGKMDVVRAAGFWMRDNNGSPTRAFQHINWDGCMFSNETMMELKRAYRLLFRSDLNMSQALEKAEAELEPLPEVVEFLAFMRASSQRGVTS